MKIILEACVTTLKDALHAEASGAHRIELCEHLEHDGLTPSNTLVKECLDQLMIPVKVLIRPRSGDFLYNDIDFKTIITSIKDCKSLGVNEVVVGVLDKKQHLDISRLKNLIEIAHPMRVSIHKAFDETPNLVVAVSKLINLTGITSILTSGGMATAIEGQRQLRV